MSLLWLPVASIVSSIVSGAISGSSGSSKSSSSNSSSGASSNISYGSSKNSSSQNVGYAYTDKYGFSHVVADRETAEKYGQPGSIQEYTGNYSGGYARDNEGNRIMVNTPGAIPYGNDVSTYNYEQRLNELKSDYERKLQEQQIYYDRLINEEKQQRENEQRQREEAARLQQEELERKRLQEEQQQKYLSNYSQNVGLYGTNKKSPYYFLDDAFKKRSKSGAKIGITEGGKKEAISRYLARDIWANK